MSTCILILILWIYNMCTLLEVLMSAWVVLIDAADEKDDSTAVCGHNCSCRTSLRCRTVMLSLTTSGLQVLPARHRVVEGRPEVLEVEPEDHEEGDLEGGCNDRLEADWTVLSPRKKAVVRSPVLSLQHLASIHIVNTVHTVTTVTTVTTVNTVNTVTSVSPDTGQYCPSQHKCSSQTRRHDTKTINYQHPLHQNMKFWLNAIIEKSNDIIIRYNCKQFQFFQLIKFHLKSIWRSFIHSFLEVAR